MDVAGEFAQASDGPVEHGGLGEDRFVVEPGDDPVAGVEHVLGDDSAEAFGAVEVALVDAVEEEEERGGDEDEEVGAGGGGRC